MKKIVVIALFSMIFSNTLSLTAKEGDVSYEKEVVSVMESSLNKTWPFVKEFKRSKLTQLVCGISETALLSFILMKVPGKYSFLLFVADMTIVPVFFDGEKIQKAPINILGDKLDARQKRRELTQAPQYSIKRLLQQKEASTILKVEDPSEKELERRRELRKYKKRVKIGIIRNWYIDLINMLHQKKLIEITIPNYKTLEKPSEEYFQERIRRDILQRNAAINEKFYGIVGAEIFALINEIGFWVGENMERPYSPHALTLLAHAMNKLFSEEKEPQEESQ